MKATGYLFLWRKLWESSAYRNSTAAHKVVMFTIFANACHEPTTWWDAETGEEIVLKPGMFTTSLRKLAGEAEVSVKAVRHALARLARQGVVTVGAHRDYTLIAVQNWTNYQSNSNGGTVGACQGTHGSTRQGTHERIRKREVRTNNQEKKRRFKPPTAEEVRAYCQEKNYSVNPERFVNFYASQGWKVGPNKMKNWRAAVAGWAARDKDDAKQSPANLQARLL